MDEKCKMPKCDIRATYTFFLEGLEGVEEDIETFRCTSHMALNIAKLTLTNPELATIQKL